jgi:hypothetical protein
VAAAPPVVADTLMPHTAPPVDPPRPPAQPSTARPDNRRWIIPAAIVALASGGGDDKPTPPKPTAVPTAAPDIPLTAQGISLKVPAGWEDTGASVEIPGFEDGAVTVGGPSEQYSASVESTLAKLDKSEKTAANALRAARKRTTQVDATGKLGAAYSSAAAKLDKLEVSPADAQLNANLVASLRKTGSAYKKAAAEGRSKDRNGYRSQGNKASAAGRDIKEQLDALNAAGYQIPAGVIRSAGSTAKLPTLIKDKPKPKPHSSSTQPTTSQPQTNNTQPQTQPRTQPRTKPNNNGNDGISGGGEG